MPCDSRRDRQSRGWGDRQQQQPKKLQHLLFDRRGTVGEPDKKGPVADRVDMANEQHAGSVFKPKPARFVA